MNTSTLRRACVAIICLIPSIASAAISLPAMFADHMVLQRGMDVPVWGNASPGEKITIEFAGKKVSTTADDKGNWRARLPAMEAIKEPSSMTITGGAESRPVVVNDVLVGDVWICSGQSNMKWQLKQSSGAEEAIASADHPNLRMFRVPLITALEPTHDLKGAWQVSTPTSAGDFSAVGYFFGRELLEKEGVPIGLIDNSWGGRPIESFISDEMMRSDADFKPVLDRKAALPPETRNAPDGASNIFNAMVFPLLPYGIKGVIWYQGESNVQRAEQYRKLFPAMIKDWRNQWQQGDFPFIFVQLANYGKQAGSDWAELREAQTMTLKASPNTAMAVIIDIGESKDIHPKNKLDVGLRLALGAEKIAYGKDIEFSGPMYDSMQADGNKVRIKFAHAKGLTTKDGSPVKGFAIAGEDQKFVWAEAKIDGEDVIVWSDKIEKPASVRYGWANDPDISLYNASGLPASPFRTDDWKMVTAGAK